MSAGNVLQTRCAHVYRRPGHHCERAILEGYLFCKLHASKETKETNPLDAADIRLFTDPAAGGGRETNDAKNKKRERILGLILTTTVHDANKDHGEQWRMLRAKFSEALLSLRPSATNVSVKGKGGRKWNYDYEASYNDSTNPEHIEFKFGGIRISNLPEFFNPAADKPFHPKLYAEFFYDGGYLNDICTLYSIPVSEKPTKTEYLAAVHSNTSTVPFFARLKEAEKAEVPGARPLYDAKAAISHRSIRSFLMEQHRMTNLKALTAELQRSQTNKHFLLYSGGAFHHDRLLDEELVAESVVGVQGDYLVIQTGVPTTTIRMLLRWKNHQGILFPAWQISLVRQRLAVPIPPLSC